MFRSIKKVIAVHELPDNVLEDFVMNKYHKIDDCTYESDDETKIYYVTHFDCDGKPIMLSEAEREVTL